MMRKDKGKMFRIIRGSPLEDAVGSYFGVCTNPSHVGIVRYSYYRVCEKRNCEYYVKYRPREKDDLK